MNPNTPTNLPNLAPKPGLNLGLQKVEISFSVVLKTVALLLGLWLATQILDIIILVFITVIIVAGLRPMIDGLKKLGVPRNLSIFSVFFGFVAFLGLTLYLVLPPLVAETVWFVSNIGRFVEDIIVLYNLQSRFNFNEGELVNSAIQQLAGSLGSASGRIISVGAGIFSGVITLITSFALVFYQLAEGERIRNFVISFFGNKAKANTIYLEVERKLGSWLQGQLFLMLIIGFLTYVALLVVGIWFPEMAKFAVPLAIIAGLLEVVPVLGPTIALIPALFVAAASSPQLAGVIFLTYIGIQQIEANIIIPKVMGDAVGIDSLVVILGIMIGSALLGPLGALIAVPTCAVIIIFYQEWRSSQKPEEAVLEIPTNNPESQMPQVEKELELGETSTK